MDYKFDIYEKQTNTKSEQYRGVGNYTSLSKTKAIEKATEFLKTHESDKYYAIIYGFDWQRGNRIVGKIEI